MNKHCKALIATLCLLLTAGAGFTGCSGGDASSKKQEPDSVVSQSTDDEALQAAKEGGIGALGIKPESLGIEPEVTTDAKHMAGYQLELPEKGDPVAVVKTNMGNFRIRLFPDAAPKAVESFTKQAKAGKYNNTIFHKVIPGFAAQGGHIGNDEKQPNGESAYGKPFKDEFNDKLFNLRGAVAMANTAADANGSQFLINQMSADEFRKNGSWSYYDNMWKDSLAQLKQYKDNPQLLSAYIEENGDRMIDTDRIPKEVKMLYMQHGGNPNLDGAFNAADRGNTVFGQVFDGMETVDKITAVKTDENGLPKQSVIIKSIAVTTYTPAAAQTTAKPANAQATAKPAETKAANKPADTQE